MNSLVKGFVLILESTIPLGLIITPSPLATARSSTKLTPSRKNLVITGIGFRPSMLLVYGRLAILRYRYINYYKLSTIYYPLSPTIILLYSLMCFNCYGGLLFFQRCQVQLFSSSFIFKSSNRDVTNDRKSKGWSSKLLQKLKVLGHVICKKKINMFNKIYRIFFPS